MLILVGSTNPVKVKATEQAFAKYFSDFTVKGLSTSSNVNPYPWSDDETLQGALNRAKGALIQEPTADYSVGLEGGLQRLREWMMVKEIAVVLHENEVGVGVSVGYACPPRILSQLDQNSTTSRRNIDAFFGKQEVLSKEGPLGVLTNSKLTRTGISKDAVICALIRFVNPRYYDATGE
jgi:inosine/xanthosine triphosphatase